MAPCPCYPPPTSPAADPARDTFPQLCTGLNSCWCRVQVRGWGLWFMNHLLAFVAVAEQTMAASPLPLGLKCSGGVNQAFSGCFCGLSFEISEVSYSFRGSGLSATCSYFAETLFQPWSSAAPTPATEPLVPFAFMKPLPFKLSRREIWGLRKDFKNQPFLKLIQLLLYDLLIVWCLCVIYGHLAARFHKKKDNIVEAEMQLGMWYRREGGRGQWELLGSEMQGRKDKSFEEMKRTQNEM